MLMKRALATLDATSVLMVAAAAPASATPDLEGESAFTICTIMAEETTNAAGGGNAFYFSFFAASMANDGYR